ncbi:hypothetical protein [Flavobacterium adhaerens]|uniref:hypothetical protein n=1 Tax=Flavobacterium adhaerens TaxID=3149043 RepID=UPI0032B353CF
MKIQLPLFYLFLFLILFGCRTKYHYPLSQFKLNGKIKNNYIQERKPEYGDGNRDGCIILSEISLNLNISNDSIIGKVLDTKSGEGLISASVYLQFENNEETSIITNQNGDFSAKTSKKLLSIKIQYLGFRQIYVKL